MVTNYFIYIMHIIHIPMTSNTYMVTRHVCVKTNMTHPNWHDMSCTTMLLFVKYEKTWCEDIVVWTLSYMDNIYCMSVLLEELKHDVHLEITKGLRELSQEINEILHCKVNYKHMPLGNLHSTSNKGMFVFSYTSRVISLGFSN
jgi:hypothetical protein